MQVQYEFLYGVDRRVILWARTHIVPIEVDTIPISSVVASENPIRINYRHHIEHEFIPQQLGYICILQEPFQYSVHDMAAWHFSGVNPGTEKDGLLLSCKAFRAVFTWEHNFVFQIFLILGYFIG